MEAACWRECDLCPISSCSLNPNFQLFIQAYLRDMSIEMRRRN
jgi:hypothetical protein